MTRTDLLTILNKDGAFAEMAPRNIARIIQNSFIKLIKTIFVTQDMSLIKMIEPGQYPQLTTYLTPGKDYIIGHIDLIGDVEVLQGALLQTIDGTPILVNCTVDQNGFIKGAIDGSNLPPFPVGQEMMLRVIVNVVPSEAGSIS